ncbi:MAG TPA: YkgJ family cysteine cluster protein, partial [Geobacteraceae bacterium]
MWQELTAEIRAGQTFLEMGVRSWMTEYAARGGKIFCGRGCSDCCTLAVNVPFSETLAIAALLTDLQAARLAAHVERLIRLPTAAADMKNYLRRHRQELGPCPFLDADGACSVYAVRPCACRALLATRESRWCAMDFATLTSAEKEAFVAGLDRNVVDFPMHYAAYPREFGQEMEATAARRMTETFGFSLYGSLPLL